jgi:hypothetical protein
MLARRGFDVGAHDAPIRYQFLTAMSGAVEAGAQVRRMPEFGQRVTQQDPVLAVRSGHRRVVFAVYSRALFLK